MGRFLDWQRKYANNRASFYGSLNLGQLSEGVLADSAIERATRGKFLFNSALSETGVFGDAISGLNEPLTTHIDDALSKTTLEVEAIKGSIIANESNLITGISRSDIHYMTPKQQMLWGEKYGGQTKYLQQISSDAAGKKVYKDLLLDKPITGISRSERFLPSKLETDLFNISKMEPSAASEALREKYLYSKRSADLTYRQTAKGFLAPELKAMDIGYKGPASDWYGGKVGRELGPKQLEAVSSFQQRIRAAEEGGRRLSYKTAPYIEPIEGGITGFADKTRFVEGLKEGQKVALGDDTIARVAKAKRPSQISVPLSTGEVVSFEEANRRWVSGKGKYWLGADVAPIKLTRRPDYYGGSKEFQKWATSADLPGGKRAGWIKANFAKEFSPGIEKGTLPMDDAFLKIYGTYNTEAGRYGKWRAALYREGEEILPWNKIPQHRRLVTKHDQGVLEDIVQRREKSLIKGATAKVPLPKTKAPPMPFPSMVEGTKKTAKKAVTTAETAFKALSPMKRNVLVGTAIAAGALLLWGASRSGKRRPLDERDVPASSYGDVTRDRLMQDNLPGYQPRARITPNRQSAFTTNIDVNTEDYNNVMDYRQLANTMSSASSAALGTGSVNTNLHITDDSKSMNSHTMQRQFSEYLNR